MRKSILSDDVSYQARGEKTQVNRLLGLSELYGREQPLSILSCSIGARANMLRR